MQQHARYYRSRTAAKYDRRFTNRRCEACQHRHTLMRQQLYNAAIPATATYPVLSSWLYCGAELMPSCCAQMMTAKMGERDSREEIMKAFKLFDDDSTGFITLKNLKRVAKELGENLTDEELQVRAGPEQARQGPMRRMRASMSGRWLHHLCHLDQAAAVTGSRASLTLCTILEAACTWLLAAGRAQTAAAVPDYVGQFWHACSSLDPVL